MELKNCPFCGSKVEIEEIKMSNGTRIIFCIECEECYVEMKDVKEERLIRTWNKRVKGDQNV